MIPSDELTPLLFSAFTKEITWLEASSRYSLDELIETFYRTREIGEQTLEMLTDAQVAYSSTTHPIWSISESVTHLIFTQGLYHNKLLSISTSHIPHVVEAARGMGEGAKQNLPAAALREQLARASGQIRVALEDTRLSHDPDLVEITPSFGACNYKTWVLLMLAHEVDHLRQLVAMRRLARANA